MAIKIPLSQARATIPGVGAEVERRIDVTPVPEALAGLGATLGQVGDVFAGIVQKQRQQREANDLITAKTQYTDALRPHLSEARLEKLEQTEGNLIRYEAFASPQVGKISQGLSSNNKQAFANWVTQTDDIHLNELLRIQNEQAQVITEKSIASSLEMAELGVLDNPALVAVHADRFTQDIDSLIATGAKSKIEGEQIIKDGLSDIYETALGRIGRINPELAEKIVDFGLWDEFIDSNTRKLLQKEAVAWDKANKKEIKRQEDQTKKDLEEKTNKEIDVWENQSLPKLDDGTLTNQAIFDSPLFPTAAGHGAGKAWWVNEIDKRAKATKAKTNVTDLGYYNDRIQLALDGKCGETECYFPVLGKLSISDSKYVKKVQDGFLNDVKEDLKREIDQGTKRILISVPGTLNIFKPISIKRSNLFEAKVNELISKEDDIDKIKSMLNPSSKDYIVDSLVEYYTNIRLEDEIISLPAPTQPIEERAKELNQQTEIKSIPLKTPEDAILRDRAVEELRNRKKTLTQDNIVRTMEYLRRKEVK